MIKLESLGIEFDLANSSYNFHGEVNDCRQYGKRLISELGLQDKIIPTWGFPMAQCLTIQNQNNGFDIHTYLQRGFNHYTKTFLQGHEETHALEQFGKIKLLEAVLKVDGYLKPDFLNLNSEEKSDTGGIYALKRELQIPITDISEWRNVFDAIESEDISRLNLPLTFYLANGWVKSHKPFFELGVFTNLFKDFFEFMEGKNGKI